MKIYTYIDMSIEFEEETFYYDNEVLEIEEMQDEQSFIEFIFSYSRQQQKDTDYYIGLIKKATCLIHTNDCEEIEELIPSWYNSKKGVFIFN